jgi:hypothetical protein
LLGFLNRWNDTLATPLETGPRNFAECHLAATGWEIGKHANTMLFDRLSRRPVSLSARLFLWLLRRWRPRSRPSKTIHI